MVTVNKTLMLFRGLPGSGKSTLARCFMQGINSGRFPWDRLSVAHLEADDFFIRNGKFEYNPNLLYLAHTACFEKARAAMERNTNIVIVSNTFVRLWELEPYIKIAETFGYHVQEIIAAGSFPNEHGVPAATIERMRRHFQVRPPKYCLGNPLDDPTQERIDAAIPV